MGAMEKGAVNLVVPEDQDIEESAQEYAEKYLAENGVKRRFSEAEFEKLRQVNAKESVDLANAFFSERFLMAMEKQAERKQQTGPRVMFKTLRWTRPVWS